MRSRAVRQGMVHSPEGIGFIQAIAAVAAAALKGINAIAKKQSDKIVASTSSDIATKVQQAASVQQQIQQQTVQQIQNAKAGKMNTLYLVAALGIGGYLVYDKFKK